MELEKKKTKPVRNIVSGPTIRYHSVAMPRVKKMESPAKPTENKRLVELLEDGEEKASAPPLPPLPKLEEDGEESNVYERTFISFSDDKLLKEVFKRGEPKPEVPKKRVCALTRYVGQP
jgi:hypothetical protein